jgi:PAS domain S-box-containing protein
MDRSTSALPTTVRGHHAAATAARRLLAAIVGFCALVFLLDLVLPIGVASAVPYVLAAMAALWLPRGRERVFIALLGTGLAVLGFFFPYPAGAVFPVGLQNRTIAVLAIWTTTYLGYLLLRRTSEVHDREARLRAILDAAVDAVISADRDGRIESCNPATERMFGTPATELVGRPLHGIVPQVDVRQGAHTRQAGMVLRGRRGDGSLFPVDVSWSEVQHSEQLRSTAVVAVVRDISELVAAQERAIQAERLAAIGQTIAALSHESRNELHTLCLTAELLSRLAQDRPDLLPLVDRLRDSQERLSRLFDDVRGFAAPVVLELSECYLSEIWQRAWTELGVHREGRDAALHEVTEAVDLACLADEFRLEQVFRNLFENSLAACSGPVRIDIRCAPAEIDGEPALNVTIRDNGPGIPAEVRARIFEPFFTTKSRGSGLGMPICRRIIEIHGGTLDVIDGPGGATFQIVLPRESPAARELPESRTEVDGPSVAEMTPR